MEMEHFVHSWVGIPSLTSKSVNATYRREMEASFGKQQPQLSCHCEFTFCLE